MNCQQIIKDDWHDKYLLDQLSPEQKQEYEKHLSDCPKCSKQMKQQKQLISGIRRSGHLAMKQEIYLQAQQIREQSRSEAKYIFLRAAAVLLVAAFLPGLYYYYNHISELPMDGETIIMAPEERVAGSTPELSAGYEIIDIIQDEVLLEERVAAQEKTTASRGEDSRAAEKKHISTDGMFSEPKNKKLAISPDNARASGGGAAADIGTASGIDNVMGPDLDVPESMAFEKPPAAAAEKRMSQMATKPGQTAKMRSVSGKSVIGAMYQPKALRISYPNGIVEIVVERFVNSQLADSMYHFVSEDSLLRIYWQDLPVEYLENKEKISIRQESESEFILFFDTKSAYHIKLKKENAVINKTEE